MDELEMGMGPGAMGCIYCIKTCPHCGRDVFDTDIIYGDLENYCKYCQAEVEEEERKKEEEEDREIFEDEWDEWDEEDEDDDEFDE